MNRWASDKNFKPGLLNREGIKAFEAGNLEEAVTTFKPGTGYRALPRLSQFEPGTGIDEAISGYSR